MMAESSSSPPHQFTRNGARKTHLGRSDSLVSLARAPFSVQLHRLTSLSLPSPDSLHTRILDAESPGESLSRLRNIAIDVHKWISTASTVLSQLDADDDVEWAARGRDSLAKVENAAKRFGEIVEMFLDASTVLSARSDDRVKEEIKDLISIMDEVTHGWTGVRELLKGLKEQVSLSTEWMEIREILDDISCELDACANMVFELEEMRHLGLSSNTSTCTPSSNSSPTESAELDRLTSILEQSTDNSRSNPHQTALLRLSARIQPLRASLDFLNPRLSSFNTRAEKTFPTALEGIVHRKDDLEKRWNQVETDWKNISREFQEDEWVGVFRNVGKQATDMMESVSRSMQELRACLPSAPPFDLIEHYTAKKTYYPAAINRVLGVLDRGYKNRATFNGEIGRNYDDLLDRWNQLQAQMRNMDDALLELGSEDDVTDMSREVKKLSIVTESRPRSSGSSSSNTTLTQGAMSPTGQSSSRGSSIRSGARVSSLPTQRRESLLTTPTPRNRSVSTATTATTTATTASSSSRQSRLHIPFFTPRPRIRTPLGDRQNTATPIGTGTGGLIPIQARPRWNSSPIANVLGSPPPKVPPTKLPTVVITPSRIPRSGRATPTKSGTLTPSITPGRPTSGRQSMGSSTYISPNKRASMSVQRAVSNPNTLHTAPAPATPPVPKVPDVYNRRQTVNFSSVLSLKAKISAIPRPSTAQGMNGRSVSGPAGQAQPKWRG